MAYGPSVILPELAPGGSRSRPQGIESSYYERTASVMNGDCVAVPL